MSDLYPNWKAQADKIRVTRLNLREHLVSSQSENNIKSFSGKDSLINDEIYDFDKFDKKNMNFSEIQLNLNRMNSPLSDVTNKKDISIDKNEDYYIKNTD